MKVPASGMMRGPTSTGLQEQFDSLLREYHELGASRIAEDPTKRLEALGKYMYIASAWKNLAYLCLMAAGTKPLA